MEENKDTKQNTNEEENEYCEGCGGECDGCCRQSHPNFNNMGPISIDDQIDEMINILLSNSKEFINKFLAKIEDLRKNGLFTK
jgi:hypothetical protein